MPIDFELTQQQQDLKNLGRELARDFATRCAVGSRGGGCPSLGGYVAGTGATSGVTAAGER